MSRKNGGIIGPANTPVGGLFKGVAGGVWRMNDVANFVSNSQWPKVPENIDNSLRFNSGSSDYLNKTFNTPTNNDICTLSFWIKKTGSSNHAIWSNGSSNADETNFVFQESGAFEFKEDVSSSATFQLITNRLFRDSSAYYHIVIAFDTTQGTSSNRVKLYVNGVQETSFSTETYPSQNTNVAINSNIAQYIGRRNRATDQYFDGYLAEMVFIDGQQLDPTSFGEFDTTTGIWKPKKIGQIASAGTNSFYLDFKDSSNVGKDASGLSNNFTVNNLTSIDQSTDTCVENFAVLNPLLGPRYSTQTFSNGNLTVAGGAGHEMHTSTIAVSKGKWYYEAHLDAIGNYPEIGVIEAKNVITNNKDINTYGYGYFFNGNVVKLGSTVATYNAYTTNDTIGVALDVDNAKIYFSKNGTWQNSSNPADGTNPAITGLLTDNLMLGVNNYGSTWSVNFGSPPYTISSGNSDANGFGNFEYSVPSGYYALNTSNLNTYG